MGRNEHGRESQASGNPESHGKHRAGPECCARESLTSWRGGAQWTDGSEFGAGDITCSSWGGYGYILTDMMDFTTEYSVGFVYMMRLPMILESYRLPPRSNGSTPRPNIYAVHSLSPLFRPLTIENIMLNDSTGDIPS